MLNKNKKVNTTNAFLPHFRSRRVGTLVNLSSEITCHPLPGAGLYCASKAAVDAVSDTWAQEPAEYGIRSISIQVGTVDSTLASHMLRLVV